MSEDQAWAKICSVFPFLWTETFPLPSIEETINEEVLSFFAENGLTEFIEELVFDWLENSLRQETAPRFWELFSRRADEPDGFERFRSAVALAHDSIELHARSLEWLERSRQASGAARTVYGESSVYRSFVALLGATLHSQLPLDHQVVTRDFYNRALKVFCKPDRSATVDQDEGQEDEAHCEGCDSDVDQCECSAIMDVFYDTNRKLLRMELLEKLAGEVLTSLIHVRIKSHVQETCNGSFGSSHITDLESWLNMVMMGWLSRVYCDSDNHVSTQVMDKFRQKLLHLLYETYTRTLIDQIFNIIIEYPESSPAIEDLRVCVGKTDLREDLVASLKECMVARLLHPGVNTPDVVTAYVAAIKTLRQLDPTGVLLETVTKPVRRYLRDRDDTVRCVVSSLTEDGPADLGDELAHGGPKDADEGCPAGDAEDWEAWEPDPVDADPSNTSKSRRTSDIISMLVNVYGSKEVFVNEYRILLADRLLTQTSFDTDKEIRYLELLKLRFGESQMHYCEVMLKDLYDSKRINAHLLSEPTFQLDKLEFPTSAKILSAQFWPPFKEETLELPPFVKEHLDLFTKAFETLKGNRTLSWKHHLGSVNLEIALKDRKLSMSVTPVQATIIWHFQDKNQWTIEELSQVMHVPSTMLRRKIAFWQSQGLLREVCTDSFLLVEDNPTRSRCLVPSDVACEDDEAESAMASAHDQREEELQVFWSYIVGMLTNLDSMPLDRIHQMLKMFASQGPAAVECSVQELRHFLDRKVREHQLLYSGGLYRLPKS
ncbi:anaphase-promoting complex subunit 2 [Bacillus rossius redtenbacheri]|uniref:anaphase-promoting complex subunit 2 n=1 Tax=Bacillus rossius redtenbacheri TaxID=93214 RepID=UPI002FDD25FE